VATLLLHVARISTPGLIPKAKDTAEEPVSRVAGTWDGFEPTFAGAELAGFGPERGIDMMKD
jgi:hypothetical protein